jgi:hypothetical protein
MISIPFIKEVIWICVFTKNNKAYLPFIIYIVSEGVSQSRFHRIGLKPVVRRVWMLKGHRPIMRVQQRYEWLYVYGFAHPEAGDTHWLLLPSVNVEVFAIALEQFAQAVGAGPARRIILVLDRAGWHSSQTLDELQEVQAQRCVTIQNDPIGIHHLTFFHWWPALSS